MNSKDFKTLILDRMSKGETMEDILASITATANEIEAEKAKEKSNREVKEVLMGGTAQLIHDLAAEAQPLTERDLMLITMAWLCENTNLMDTLPEDYDFAEALDKEATELNDMLAGLDMIAEILAPKKDEPKVQVKVSCDPFIDFFKKNGIM